MGTTAVAYANRLTRVGNEAYYDTTDPLPWETPSAAPSTAPSVESRATATGRNTGGTSAPSNAPAAPRKGRRGRTLASLESSVNKPSILGG